MFQKIFHIFDKSIIQAQQLIYENSKLNQRENQPQKKSNIEIDWCVNEG